MIKDVQRFAFKHKAQTFSRVCLRLKQGVCNFKWRVGRWKRDCYRRPNVAAILGVTVMFWHGKLHTLVIRSTTLVVLFLQTVTWTGTYSIDEVCNFPRQNMTVTRRLNWQMRRFKRKQTREQFAVCGWTQIAVPFIEHTAGWTVSTRNASLMPSPYLFLRFVCLLVKFISFARFCPLRFQLFRCLIGQNNGHIRCVLNRR